MMQCWLLTTALLVFLLLPHVAPATGMMGLVDEIAIKTKTVGLVHFSHSIHGADCGRCHPQIFQKKNNSNHTTMKAMEKGKSCGACHNGKIAFSVKTNCTRCHAGDIVFKEPENGDVTFSHANHLEMYSCGDCHPDIFIAARGANHSTMSDMEAGKFCGACHNGTNAFSVAEECDSCHKM